MIVLVAPRANQADLVHGLGHVGQQLADFQAGDVGGNWLVFAANFFRRIGLKIERVVMRKPASEEHEDD
jgi:hypothetical protein